MSPVPASENTSEISKSCYPFPVATHEEVLNQPELFFNTLKTVLSMLGTKFMVPVIGKKELDLHLLYVEVTKRGGYDKVVMEKKWREISTIFNFSSTATSASFVLKKYYQNLLYHYEQVYFFNTKDPDSPSLLAPQPLASYPIVNDHEKCGFRSAHDSPIQGPPCNLAMGTIVGKFDCGYLVTVKMGDQLLSGVIYHPNKEPEDLSMAIVPYDQNINTQSSRKHRRKRKRRGGGDPNRPKPNRSGYNFFFAEKHATLKSLYPNREREFTKMIGEAWTNLTLEERSVYQDIGLRDKERYKRELKEYHERLGTLRKQPRAIS